MAIKQVPVIDAAEATQSINYNEVGGGLNQVVELAGTPTVELAGTPTVQLSGSKRPSQSAPHNVGLAVEGAQWMSVRASSPSRRFTVYVSTSRDGINYSRARLQNARTGDWVWQIRQSEDYLVDLSGAEFVRWTLHPNYIPANVNVGFTFLSTGSPITPPHRDVYVPKISSDLTTGADEYHILNVSQDGGTLYARPSPTGINNRLYRSVDSGDTFSWFGATENVYPWADQRVEHILELYTGELLVFTSAADLTSIWKASGPEYQDWTLVYNASGNDLGTPWREWPVSAYRDVIVYAPYMGWNASQPDRKPGPVMLSTDAGATFKAIREIPTPAPGDTYYSQRMHWHDCVYDPYRKRIWLLRGDGLNQGGFVEYSDDWGETWHTVWPNGEGVQFTVVVPLPDSVLFGSDDQQDPGAIWRATFDGGDAGRINMECISINQNNPALVGRSPLVWGADAMYFTRDGTGVFATRDGATFYSVWDTPVPKAVDKILLGVFETEDALIVNYMDSWLGKTLQIPRPTWYKL